MKIDGIKIVTRIVTSFLPDRALTPRRRIWSKQRTFWAQLLVTNLPLDDQNVRRALGSTALRDGILFGGRCTHLHLNTESACTPVDIRVHHGSRMMRIDIRLDRAAFPPTPAILQQFAGKSAVKLAELIDHLGRPIFLAEHEHNGPKLPKQVNGNPR